MAEIVFLIPARDVDSLHRTLSMLSFQKDHSFRAVLVDLAGSEAVRSVATDFEHQFPISVETVDPAGQPLSNRKWRLKTRPDRIFTRVFVDKDEAPLSSFVFRARTLREAFAVDSEAAGMGLAVILTAAKKTGVRTVRWERVGFAAPAPTTDPALVEKEVRARLAFFRWSERFFGDDYPLEVGERLTLFATELARLYPSFSPDTLKEDMNTFAVVNGPIRRMRASSALKSALKARQEALTTPSLEK